MRSHTPDRPALDVPCWEPSDRRPRALVEHALAAVRERTEADLRARGYEVVTCAGPRAGTGCPELRQEPCPAVEGADLVVNGLDDLLGHMVARRVRARHPERLLTA